MNISAMKTLGFLAVTALVAAFLIGGRYTITGTGHGAVAYVVDRFTGQVFFCNYADACVEVPYRPKAKEVASTAERTITPPQNTGEWTITPPAKENPGVSGTGPWTKYADPWAVISTTPSGGADEGANVPIPPPGSKLDAPSAQSTQPKLTSPGTPVP